MNIAEHAPETILGHIKLISDASGAAVPYRRHVYVGCVVLALACNYVLGKDMAWDTLNYHLYLGYSALNDRFGLDYFAAGTLSYLNPYAYVPFYAMVRAGLPALAICSVFAAVHSIILWLSFELGVAVCPSKDGRTRAFAGSCAVALAFMNPILMQQIGSCFADITTAELALGGWLLLAGAVRVPRMSRVIYAGLILGAASALKLSNALSAVSAFAMLAMLPLGWRGKIRHGLFYGISVVHRLCGHRRPMVVPSREGLRQPHVPDVQQHLSLAGIPDGIDGNCLSIHSGVHWRGTMASLCHDRSHADAARGTQRAGPALRHPRRTGRSVRSALGLAALCPGISSAEQSATEPSPHAFLRHSDAVSACIGSSGCAFPVIAAMSWPWPPSRPPSLSGCCFGYSSRDRRCVTTF